MMTKRLSVALPGHVVGELSQNRGGRTTWTSDLRWLAGEQMPRLGLAFLRDPGPRRHSSDLPAWFENLLPERGTILRYRLAQAHGLREGQSFELFRALGEDFIGAVTAASAERSESAQSFDD